MQGAPSHLRPAAIQLFKNVSRAFSRIPHEHQNRPYSAEFNTLTNKIMQNNMFPFIRNTYGNDIIGASILVTLTLEDLLSKNVDLYKSGVLIVPGHEMAMLCVNQNGMKMNNKSKADGIVYYEIFFNGPHLGDVIRGLGYLFDTDRLERIESKEDLYQMGIRMSKGKISNQAIVEMSDFIWNNREHANKLKTVVDEMCQSTHGKTQEEIVQSLYCNKSRSCAGCNKVGIAFSKCGGCKAVYYCGTDCQKRHWPVHKKECKK